MLTARSSRAPPAASATPTGLASVVASSRAAKTTDAPVGMGATSVPAQRAVEEPHNPSLIRPRHRGQPAGVPAWDLPQRHRGTAGVLL